MIKLNEKKDFTILKAIAKNDIKNKFVSKLDGAFTLISEENVIYFTVGEKKCKRNLSRKLEIFAQNCAYDFNVDVDSFVKVYDFKNDEIIVKRVVEAIIYGNRDKLSYKKEKPKSKIVNLFFDKKYEAIINESIIKLEYQILASELQDTPPNIGTAPYFADLFSKKAKEIENVKITILNKKQIEALKMGLLLSVNAGSNNEPRVVVIEYCSDPKKEKIAFVGKGITFDSGGYNLKPSSSMIGMKMDMSGAVVALSSVLAMAKAKIKTNVVAIGMFTDNRIGSNATLTESVITSMEGSTVEIENTDAEGRLVLADGLHYAIEKYEAKKIVDIATLTGAMLFSLGSYYTGIFSTNDDFANEFLGASKIACEDVWRLPLDSRHLKAMQTSKIADLSNIGSKKDGAGSSTAAAFLNYFTKNVPFVHVDIAGTDQGIEVGRGCAVMLKSFFELAKK